MSRAWLLLVFLSALGAAVGRRIGQPPPVAETPMEADEDPDALQGPDAGAELNQLGLSRPSYIQCQSSQECDEDHCCVLGGDRYSIPSCRPLQQMGGVCRPNGHEPFNTTVGYPDHAQVDLHVFWLFCPCASGLTCQRKSTSCQSE